MSATKIKINQIRKITTEELDEQALVNVPDEEVKIGGNGIKGWLDLLGKFVMVGGDLA